MVIGIDLSNDMLARIKASGGRNSIRLVTEKTAHLYEILTNGRKLNSQDHAWLLRFSDYEKDIDPSAILVQGDEEIPFIYALVQDARRVPTLRFDNGTEEVIYSRLFRHVKWEHFPEILFHAVQNQESRKIFPVLLACKGIDIDARAHGNQLLTHFIFDEASEVKNGLICHRPYGEIKALLEKDALFEPEDLHHSTHRYNFMQPYIDRWRAEWQQFKDGELKPESLKLPHLRHFFNLGVLEEALSLPVWKGKDLLKFSLIDRSAFPIQERYSRQMLQNVATIESDDKPVASWGSRMQQTARTEEVMQR